ncbi:MAG: hypothetical protein NZO58_09825 [Gemmataceae bacterium]|nr:hypothetical protein [Gemmataceae bacterium]
MQFQFDITTAPQARPVPVRPGAEGIQDLLRQLIDLQRDSFAQIVELQREQLNHARAIHHENLQRWKNVMLRWGKEFPDLAAKAKQVYPMLEKTYLGLLEHMVQDLIDQGEEGFASEFALQDFIDRHGMRVGQLGHLLSIVGPLSEAAPQPEQPPGTT